MQYLARYTHRVVIQRRQRRALRGSALRGMDAAPYPDTGAQEAPDESHYARAVAAGAEIVIEIKDEDYGGRDFSCRDPEGHVWNFGSYDPWASA